MVSKPRIISSSGKDVTGTSAASSERRSSNSSSSRDTSTSPAARKGYSSSKKKEDKKKDTSDGKPRVVRRTGEERKEAQKIKTTAERQAEARREAGGGKDYTDIPEGTAVTREKQAEAVRESSERARRESEQAQKQYIQEYGVTGLTSARLGRVPDQARFQAIERASRRPERFDLGGRETQRFAGQETRRDLQMEEQRRREQQFRAQEAMSLEAQRPTLQVERGPALTVARSKQPEFEKAATGYEQRVGSALSPLTTSTSPVLQFAGGAAETVAYAPTGIPRLAVGLAREPTSVVGETARTQVETLRTQPARGLGQISAMLVGPKAVRGITRRGPFGRALEKRAMTRQFEARYKAPTGPRRIGTRTTRRRPTVETVERPGFGELEYQAIIRPDLRFEARAGRQRTFVEGQKPFADLPQPKIPRGMKERSVVEVTQQTPIGKQTQLVDIPRRATPRRKVPTRRKITPEQTLVRDRGITAFLRSEEAQLRPTQAVRPQTQQVGRPVFGDAFRTATQRRGAVFQRGRIVSRSESRLGAIGTVGLAASVARGVEQGTSPTQIDFTIPTAITRPVTAQTQPQIQRTTTPQIQRQVPVSPLRTTTPTRTVPRTPTVRQPKMPEPVIPRALPRKKKETDKKKRGRKTGFEFYDVENPLAGFDKVFNMGNKR